jgi:hypothetical protein
MCNKERSIRRKAGDLQCPVCHKSIDDPNSPKGLDVTEEDRLLLPQPGDLTECCHCEAMLEYGGDVTLLTLHPAPRQRIDSFNALTREAPDEPSFPELITELITYVMKYRQCQCNLQSITDSDKPSTNSDFGQSELSDQRHPI